MVGKAVIANKWLIFGRDIQPSQSEEVDEYAE